MRSIALFAAVLIALASPAQADPRDVLRDCQSLLDHAKQPNAAKPGDADIARRTLRESGMLVDEQGRPLR